MENTQLSEGWVVGRQGEKGEGISKEKTHRHRQRYGDYQSEKGVGGGRRR